MAHRENCDCYICLAMNRSQAIVGRYSSKESNLKETKMIEKFELDELNNDTLIQQSKNCNGALYTRINRLQRDLNIANAEVKRLNGQVTSLRMDLCYPCSHKNRVTELETKLKKIQEAIEAFKS